MIWWVIGAAVSFYTDHAQFIFHTIDEYTHHPPYHLLSLVAFFHSFFFAIFLLFYSLPLLRVTRSSSPIANANKTEPKLCKSMVSIPSLCVWVCMSVYERERASEQVIHTRDDQYTSLDFCSVIVCDCGYPFNYTKKVKSNIKIKQQLDFSFKLYVTKVTKSAYCGAGNKKKKFKPK